MSKGGKISPETEFKKGQSGNPKGRPKKLPPLKEALAEALDDGGVEQILTAMRKKAATGDTQAARLILEYGYHKPKQQHEVTGADGGAIETVIRFVDDENDEGYFYKAEV